MVPLPPPSSPPPFFDVHSYVCGCLSVSAHCKRALVVQSSSLNLKKMIRSKTRIAMSCRAIIVERSWQMNVWRSIEFTFYDIRINLICFHPAWHVQCADAWLARPQLFSNWTQNEAREARRRRDIAYEEIIEDEIENGLLCGMASKRDEWDIARKWSRSDLNLHSMKWCGCAQCPTRCLMWDKEQQ